MASPAERSVRGGDDPVRAGLTPASAALLVGAVVIAFVLRNAFVAAHRTVGWVIACAIVALLIDPLVDFVDRLLPRVLASSSCCSPSSASIAASRRAGPRPRSTRSTSSRTRGAGGGGRWRRNYDWAADIGVADRVTDFVADLDKRVRKDTVSKALGTAPTYVVTGILMLFLLVVRPALLRGLRRPVRGDRRERIRDVGQEAAVARPALPARRVGQSIVNGAVVGLTCWALGLPAAVSLGFVVGLLPCCR